MFDFLDGIFGSETAAKAKPAADAGAAAAPAPAPAPIPPGPGGGSPEAATAAFGHYADGAAPAGTGMGDVRIAEARNRDFEAWKQTPDGQAAGPNEEAAKRIDLQYDYTYAQHDPTEKLGDLSSPEAREKALSMITQNGVTDDPMAMHRCAAASVIGGVLHAEGPDGMQKLIKHMESFNDPKAPKDPQMEAIKKKLAAGGSDLTLADMQTMQDSLYNTMKYKMEGANVADVNADPEHLGSIQASTVKDFISGNPELAKMFLDHHMTINNIDNAGDGKPHHFVLGLRGEGGDLQKVYDPQLRAGGQMVTADWAVHDYDLANKFTVKPDERI